MTKRYYGAEDFRNCNEGFKMKVCRDMAFLETINGFSKDALQEAIKWLITQQDQKKATNFEWLCRLDDVKAEEEVGDWIFGEYISDKTPAQMLMMFIRWLKTEAENE